jgi:hypothetical protein
MLLTRRTLLTGFAPAGVLALIAPAVLATPALEHSRAQLARLRALMRDQHSARAIGKIYLRGTPEEADRQGLVMLILAAMALPASELPRIPASRLASLLHETISADFSSGRTVNLHGWILSVTEARVCALWV